jgi:hypothetical protein
MMRYVLLMGLMFPGLGITAQDEGDTPPLDEGHYQLLVPALFPPAEGDDPTPYLAYLSYTKGERIKINMKHLHRGILYLYWEGGKTFSIVPKVVQPSGLPSGTARLVAPNTLKGTMEVRNYAPSALRMELHKGEWSLRPATEREVKQRFVEMLARSADSIHNEVPRSELGELQALDSTAKRELIRRNSRAIELAEEKGLRWVRQGEVRLDPDSRDIEFELTTGPPDGEARGPEIDPRVEEKQRRLTDAEIQLFREGRKRQGDEQEEEGRTESPAAESEAKVAQGPESPEGLAQDRPPRQPDISHEVETETGFLFWTWKEWLAGLIVLVLVVGGGIWWARRRQ